MKTLQECKDQIAKAYGYDSFNQLHKENTILYDTRTSEIINHITELYASQFKAAQPEETQESLRLNFLELITSKIEKRPSTKDYNFNYVHQEEVHSFIDEIFSKFTITRNP